MLRLAFGKIWAGEKCQRRGGSCSQGPLANAIGSSWYIQGNLRDWRILKIVVHTGSSCWQTQLATKFEDPHCGMLILYIPWHAVCSGEYIVAKVQSAEPMKKKKGSSSQSHSSLSDVAHWEQRRVSSFCLLPAWAVVNLFVCSLASLFGRFVCLWLVQFDVWHVDTLTRSFPSVVCGDVLVEWYAAMPHWSRPGYMSTTRRPGQHTQTFCPKCMCEVCVSVCCKVEACG